MTPRYPFPWYIAYQITRTLLIREKRIFHRDARACISRLTPSILVQNRANIPISGPTIITVNHYSRSGFRAWWIALAISAVVAKKINWVITSAWTYPDWLRSHSITPLTSIILRQIAHVYDFICMPPMPPRPVDAYARASSVRRILSLARNPDPPIIAVAPEGRDPVLSERYSPTDPPPGFGRLIFHLAKLDFSFVPVGAYEKEGRFCLNFGPTYQLNPPLHLRKTALDMWVSQVVMARISALLPDF